MTDSTTKAPSHQVKPPIDPIAREIRKRERQVVNLHNKAKEIEGRAKKETDELYAKIEINRRIIQGLKSAK